MSDTPIPKGRGTPLKPPNRFEKMCVEADWDHLEHDEDHLASVQKVPTDYFADNSKSVVSENDSPDIPFRYSLNPFRGCSHGCPYCYARPSHELLGFNAGLDFETKIVVKHDAPDLLRDFLAKDSWNPDPITFSGVTDCYQPAERKFQLTRRCLEVVAECYQPVSIVTKNALVTRDLDILKRMASNDLVHVFLSVTTLEAELARDMEPRTSIPSARLRAIGMLADAGVPVGVMVAPVIPGLNDTEVPGILEAAKNAGAMVAGYVLLRLPLTVEPVFIEWLERTQPLKAERVLGRVRETRGGKLNNSQWGERMIGSGEMAEQIRNMFHVFKKKFGLDQRLTPHNCDIFKPPLPKSGQQRLF